MCGYYLRMCLVYLLKYSSKVGPSLVPRCSKNWYTLFTYPLGKTFYRVSTLWFGWMLLLSCNSPPLRVMTLDTWLCNMETCTVVSKFPRKHGELHMHEQCVPGTPSDFSSTWERNWHEWYWEYITVHYVFTMYKNCPFSFPPAMCN